MKAVDVGKEEELVGIFEAPGEPAHILVFPEYVIPDIDEIFVRDLDAEMLRRAGIELARRDTAALEIPRQVGIEEGVVDLLRVEMEEVDDLAR